MLRPNNLSSEVEDRLHIILFHIFLYIAHRLSNFAFRLAYAFHWWSNNLQYNLIP